MRFYLAPVALSALLFFSGSQAATAPSIGECPSLKPRASPAVKVNDLRPDDIKVVAALGDSIMAAFGAKGIQGGTIINIKNLFENRGVSYGGGGDDGAITVPNLIKKYNPGLQGASVGEHLGSVCYGPICPPFQYRPLRDRLNAAQSGGMAMNLDYMLDYLIPAMKLSPGVNYKNDWKLINVQIGSNDQCASCIDEFIDILTPELYGRHLDAAVEKIRANIPRVLVNLVGVFNVTGVYSVTEGQSYCKPIPGSDLIINTVECPCALDKKYRPKIDATAAGYSQQVRNIYDKYKKLQTDSFGVMFTPANIDVSTFPVQALSNIDCFHPSEFGHQYITRTLWNTFFIPLEQKPQLFTWKNSTEVYCPNEADRFQLD